MAITGVLSALASYNPFKRCIAPGPEVATHAPSFPVYFAISASHKCCQIPRVLPVRILFYPAVSLMLP